MMSALKSTFGLKRKRLHPVRLSMRKLGELSALNVTTSSQKPRHTQSATSAKSACISHNRPRNRQKCHCGNHFLGRLTVNTAPLSTYQTKGLRTENLQSKIDSKSHRSPHWTEE